MSNLTLFPKESPARLIWRALFPLLALVAGVTSTHSALAQAAFRTPNTVTFNRSLTGEAVTTTTYFNRANTGNTPKYQDAPLGGSTSSSFDQATGTLTLSNLSVPISVDPGDPSTGTPATVVNSVTLYYLVYPTGTTASNLAALSPTAVALTNTSSTATTQTYTYTGAPIDILHQQTVLGGGNYTVRLLITAVYDDSGNGSNPQPTSDPGSGLGRTATFSVIAPAVTPNGGTTTWTSQSSTDWRSAANWSNGVPTRNSDAIIPEKTATGTTSTPILVDANNPYEVRTITLNGTTNSTRALLRIGQSTSGSSPAVGATLRVYGDLNTYSGGILASVSGTNGTANPATNSTIVLAGDNGGVQVVRGLLEIVDMRIEGNGTKAVINSIASANTFIFASTSTAIVQTSNDDASKDPSTGLSTSVPSLNTTKTATVNLKDSGFLFGEKPSSFIRGITIADRALLANVKQTFGNIGIDITPSRDIPSPNVNITRTVGDPLFGPNGSTATAPAGSPQPVKRQYGISGDVNNNTTSTITFHYLNSADELNGNPEANLTIFKTANNAPPYVPVGRTGTVKLGSSTGDGTVTREAYRGSLNTLTLGDEFNPLPVSLTAFNAVRSTSNALLTWTTASEQNNKGFEVQVATDGSTFRALGFVDSGAPNSAQIKEYKYTDTESGKFGTRYYRLRQVDLDGKSSYSPVRAVSFDGLASTSGAIVAYPNPFTGSDKINFNFDAAVHDGVAHLKLVDAVGRTVRDQSVTLNGASITVGDLDNLLSGMYLARITLPDGTTQSVRIQKH